MYLKLIFKMKKIKIVIAFVCLATLQINAQDSLSILRPQKPVHKQSSIELNIFLPFLGVTDLKFIAPINSNKNSHFKNALILGIFADYSWGKLTRPVNDFGKVRFIGARLGWRQFFWKGVHMDAILNAGQRHEEKNIYDGSTLNSFTSRLWLLGGIQGDINTKVYFNIRAGAGIHIIRYGDAFAYTERKLLPAFEINIGFRL